MATFFDVVQLGEDSEISSLSKEMERQTLPEIEGSCERTVRCFGVAWL